MLCTCIYCGGRQEFDGMIQSDAARRALVPALAMPPSLAAATVQYLRLFASPSAPQRALLPERYETLLTALANAVRDGKIDHKGRAWSAPLATWAAAFDAIFEQRDAKALRLPLKSHAYLYGVIANMGNATEAKAEVATEAQRKTGRTLNETQPTASDVDQALARGEAAFVDLSTSVTNRAQDPSTGETDEKPSREIPAAALAVMAALTSRKSMSAVTAQQAALDAPVDPLIGCMATVAKGKWKGKGGQIVRVAGEQIYLAIQFPRNGLQTIPFQRSELDL